MSSVIFGINFNILLFLKFLIVGMYSSKKSVAYILCTISLMKKIERYYDLV